MARNRFMSDIESAGGNLSILGNIEKNKTIEKENILYLLNNSVQFNLSTDIINRLNEQLKEIDLQIGLVSFLQELIPTQRDNDIKAARALSQSAVPNDEQGNKSLDSVTSISQVEQSVRKRLVPGSSDIAQANILFHRRSELLPSKTKNNEDNAISMKSKLIDQNVGPQLGSP